MISSSQSPDLVEEFLSDSIVAPPRNQRFSSTSVSRLLDTRKDTTEKKKVSMYFPVCKGQSVDDVGMSRDTAFQEIRPIVLAATPDTILTVFMYRSCTIYHNGRYGIYIICMARATIKVALFGCNGF